MTREIKFRAWIPRYNEIRAVKDIKYFDNGNIRINATDKDTNYEPFLFMLNHEGKELCEFILMQYTGLLDKNGREIYEGDIFQHGTCDDKPILYIIEWQQESAGFGWKQVRPVLTIAFSISEVEVIGNVYEHPELLKGND